MHVCTRFVQFINIQKKKHSICIAHSIPTEFHQLFSLFFSYCKLEPFVSFGVIPKAENLIVWHKDKMMLVDYCKCCI